jgi:hypothetical protein
MSLQNREEYSSADVSRIGPSGSERVGSGTRERDDSHISWPPSHQDLRLFEIAPTLRETHVGSWAA